MKYYLIVGEASGDLHASNLMRALKVRDAEAQFRFYGGDLMAAQGGELVRHYREMAYMGFIPVLMHLPTILRGMRECKNDIVGWKPDVLILVDYPGFNLDVAKYIHKNTDIPIYYYISPKTWAWKEYRIKTIRRDVDEMFSILPFEVEFYRKHNYAIHYVGNPCVDAVKDFLDGRVDSSDSAPSVPTIAILAGSRRQEIKDNLKMMLKAASSFENYRLVIAGAPSIEEDYYHRFIPKGMEVEIRFGETYETVLHADAALVTSGTATLETALLRTPQVVCYYTPCGKLVKALRAMLLKVPFISLVNLIAGSEVVPELVADRMTVENICSYLRGILPGGKDRQTMLDGYGRMADILGPAGASERTAELMVKMLSGEECM
ncbi:MAG: lipid-A-disaccharide synthase [Bacteroidaceae bacterium]|nr:lipid-A-disaccharide synthase [Bacteroidaceae bacterium]